VLIRSLAMLSVATLCFQQEAHRLDRFPVQALLAEGRVVESAPASLIIEVRDVSVDGYHVLGVERISFDLGEAEGGAYFLQEDEEVSLAEGLRRLRPGSWIEVSPMPEHEFSQWRVAGTHGSIEQPRPGSIDAMLRPQPRVRHLGVRGWLYVWVVTEPHR